MGFDHIENKHNFCRWKDCTKIFRDSLREHAKNVIDFEKKMLSLTRKELKSHEDAKEWYICRKKIKKNAKVIDYQKVKYHCYYTGKYKGTANNISNLTFKVLNKIHVAFHNGSSYDYYFIVKGLANESECLGENKEK